MEEFDILLPTFQHMPDSFKIGEFVNNDNIDTGESRSVTNTNNNEDAIKKYSKMMKISQQTTF